MPEMQEKVMPELPEVETIVRELKPVLMGKEIREIKCFRPGTVIDRREQAATALGKIISISRRGKYIILEMDRDLILLIHLRMTGKLIYQKKAEKQSAHCRAEILFTDESQLYFDDVRTFGKIEIMGKNKLAELMSLKLGSEPLSAEFTSAYLSDKIKGKKAPIKSLLLNQEVVAGLGNIYVCEILHRAGVSPLRSGENLSRSEINKIVKETRQVLGEAIEKNGTTISDYRRVDDKKGEFQNFLRVYGKETCNCGNKIEHVKQSGRTSYYCPVCQK
jgi:formamidopyrimidine-DNA glycosylase